MRQQRFPILSLLIAKVIFGVIGGLAVAVFGGPSWAVAAVAFLAAGSVRN